MNKSKKTKIKTKKVMSEKAFMKLIEQQKKKVSKFKFLHKLTEAQTNVSHRPSLLYTLDAEKYAEMKADGFSLDL